MPEQVMKEASNEKRQITQPIIDIEVIPCSVYGLICFLTYEVMVGCIDVGTLRTSGFPTAKS